MIEHPEIRAMMQQGYVRPEPKQVGKCANCGEEILAGEKVVEGAGYLYCDATCYGQLALKEGNISLVVAE